MPVVTIQMLEGRSVEQKRQLVEAITRAMVEIARAKPEAVEVVIQEVPSTNWARSGKLLSDQQ